VCRIKEQNVGWDEFGTYDIKGLIGSMAPQVFTLSEQCTLHSSKVNYATKHFKFRSVRCISMQITGM